MQILVITSLPDPHLEMVRTHLPKDCELVVFDPYQFPKNESLSVLWNQYGLNVKVKGGNVTNPIAVWYRKPILLTPEKMPVLEPYRKFTHASYAEGIIWLYSAFPNSFWVSDYWKIKQAGSKVYQLNLAITMGFVVPDTLITSDAMAAQDFLREHTACVVKPLNLEFLELDGKLLATYTSRVQPGQVLDFSGLAVAPVIFQQEIVGTDIRVTVIGDKVFACAVERPTHTNQQVDWRIGLSDNTSKMVQDHAFPADLTEKCLLMVKRLGLQFGALDFIRDEGTGKYYFLEINPNGQWGFVELDTGLPLAHTMAQLLLSQS